MAPQFKVGDVIGGTLAEIFRQIVSGAECRNLIAPNKY